jgi:hypothetical protein
VLVGIISLSFSPFVISTNAEGTDWTEYANNPVFDPDAKAYYLSVIYDAIQFSGLVLAQSQIIHW